MTFIDTPGAFPGPASEERGVAEAIARSIQVMAGLRTPIVTVITGEGGSGGALALAVGDVVLALENSIYSVISPEGCAVDPVALPEFAQQAAVAMRLTAAEQLALGVIDEVVAEPAEGAHTTTRDRERLRERIVAPPRLRSPVATPTTLLEARYARYRRWASSRSSRSAASAAGAPRPRRPYPQPARRGRAASARRCRAAAPADATSRRAREERLTDDRRAPATRAPHGPCGDRPPRGRRSLPRLIAPPRRSDWASSRSARMAGASALAREPVRGPRGRRIT